MSRNTGTWHYEYYPEIPDKGKPWRVADDVHDDLIQRYATEAEARDIVRQHNAQFHDRRPESWKT